VANASRRRAFTLIEVVGAMAAFTIAFLAGSAAFARLLQQQTVNYHRSLGSAAAMLLTDWHVDANDADSFLDNTSDLAVNPSRPLLRLGAVGTKVRFRGADYHSSDAVCVFNPSADNVDLKIYGSLIVTVSVASSREADSHLTWRQVTLWYGSAAGVQANKPTSLEYVGRYLVPDTHTP
jgi:hypothetical protein